MKKLVIASVLLCFTSCALIIDGTKYKGKIVVENHPKAEIFFNEQKIGEGTAVSKFKRNKKLIINVKEEGCETKQIVYPTRFKPGLFIVSAVLWGGIGGGIDAATGASFEPNFKKDSTIQKVNSQNFIFKVDYSECKK